jgi:hypothetical protein
LTSPSLIGDFLINFRSNKLPVFPIIIVSESVSLFQPFSQNKVTWDQFFFTASGPGGESSYHNRMLQPEQLFDQMGSFVLVLWQ